MTLNIQQLSGQPRRVRIGVIAQETGASPRQIRYWIQNELVDRPHGHAGGARYSTQHVRQIQHVINCLAHGQKIDSIAHLRSLDAAPDLSDSGWTDGSGNAIPRHDVWRHSVLTKNMFIATRASRSSLEQKILKELERIAKLMLNEAIESKGKTTRKSQ